jgi:hypothetical protein
MTRGLGGRSPANLQKFLAGVHYPASKNDLLSAARKNKAPREIMDLVENMPDQEFGGPQDVQRAYGDLQ